MARPTEEIRKACGIIDGVSNNEFAEVSVNKQIIKDACDKIDEAFEDTAKRLMPEGSPMPRGGRAGEGRVMTVTENTELIKKLIDGDYSDENNK